jgi:hypothetical protein
MGYRRNEYEKKKLNKKYNSKRKKERRERDEDILLQMWKEQRSFNG